MTLGIISAVEETERLLSLSPSNSLPETVILYHTTPACNKDSILRYGITPAKYDVEDILAQIDSMRPKTDSKRALNAMNLLKKMARDRVLQIFRDKNVDGYVCLSGNKRYSAQNGCASREWMSYFQKNPGSAEYKTVMVQFTVEIPTRMFELLTCMFYKSVVEKFFDLYTHGYFDLPRVASYSNSENPIEGYDTLYLYYVPPEFIVSWEEL